MSVTNVTSTVHFYIFQMFCSTVITASSKRLPKRAAVWNVIFFTQTTWLIHCPMLLRID